jgi:hypothetical protein
MQVIGVTNPQPMPAGDVPEPHERLALYDAMFAYAGTYSVKGRVITHHVEISWNRTWNGTDQIRYFELNGTTLILTTDILNPVTGAPDHYAATWEKV